MSVNRFVEAVSCFESSLNKHMGRSDFTRSLDAANKLARKYGYRDKESSVTGDGGSQTLRVGYYFPSEKAAKSFIRSVESGKLDFEESEAIIATRHAGINSKIYHQQYHSGPAPREAWRVGVRITRTKAYRDNWRKKGYGYEY